MNRPTPLKWHEEIPKWDELIAAVMAPDHPQHKGWLEALWRKYACNQYNCPIGWVSCQRTEPGWCHYWVMFCRFVGSMRPDMTREEDEI